MFSTTKSALCTHHTKEKKNQTKNQKMKEWKRKKEREGSQLKKNKLLCCNLKTVVMWQAHNLMGKPEIHA